MNPDYPPELPESKLYATRHCLHSWIQGSSKNLLPDYVCKLTGRMCVFYTQAYCNRHERYAGIRGG